MEPPCEHGGVKGGKARGYARESQLQWSRRVNTAECDPAESRRARACASMEPPCEHGGVP